MTHMYVRIAYFEQWYETTSGPYKQISNKYPLDA